MTISDGGGLGVSTVRLMAALATASVLSLALASWLGTGTPVGDARPLVLLACHVVTPAVAAVAC